MVRHTVPRLQTFIALAFATFAAAFGCSDDFEGCAASRTCPANEAGAGGEAGAGTETGGASGSSSGTSGAAGSSGGGRGGTADTGGTGGSSASAGEGGGDVEPPTVEAFTPSDGSADVERDIEVTAELSEPVDEETVTETSVTLTGPDGEVTGTLSVDENVISFVPERPLYLLGTYTFTLDDTVADLAGNTLEQGASAEFRVRDGRWSAITTPFGTTGRYMSGFAQNANGDVLIGGTQPTAPSTMWAALYAADERRWLPVDTMSPGQDVNAAGMRLDDHRRAVFGWYGQANRYGWFRFTESEGWTDAGALPNYPFVAVSSEGKATAVWTDEMVISERTLDVSTGALEPVAQVDSAGYVNPQIVASLDRMAVFTHRLGASGGEISVIWQNSAGGWNAREPLATAPIVDQMVVASDEQGNIVLLWVDFDETRGSEMWSRVYERENAAWTRAQHVMSAPPYSYFQRPAMSSGNIAVTIYGGDMAWTGAYYEKGTGWVQSSFVDLDGLGNYDPFREIYVELGIDRRGNVLAVGQTGYRRYVPGDGWQPIVEHGLDVDSIRRFWMSAAPDGSTIAVTNALTANDELIPQSVRFE